jgi:hypothetical protein
VQDGEREKHRAQQKLVGDGIEVLAEERLLMEAARELAVEAVAESGDDEEDQRGGVVTVDEAVDDEGQKQHAQERELVRRGEDLAEVHAVGNDCTGSVTAVQRLKALLLLPLRRHP